LCFRRWASASAQIEDEPLTECQDEHELGTPHQYSQGEAGSACVDEPDGGSKNSNQGDAAHTDDPDSMPASPKAVLTGGLPPRPRRKAPDHPGPYRDTGDHMKE
jgi:hypothetical protein